MRQNERRGRKNHKSAVNYTKHFSRLLHFPDGEVWSWRVNKNRNGVLTRDPTGKDRSIPPSAFRARIDWSTKDFYCCEFCCPTWGGPGYKPSVIKRYIEVVFKQGKHWDREAEWQSIGWNTASLVFPEKTASKPDPKPVYDPYHWAPPA